MVWCELPWLMGVVVELCQRGVEVDGLICILWRDVRYVCTGGRALFPSSLVEMCSASWACARRSSGSIMPAWLLDGGNCFSSVTGDFCSLAFSGFLGAALGYGCSER